jgi:hypothetical protein
VPHTYSSHGGNGAQSESTNRHFFHGAKSVSQHTPAAHIRYSLKAEIATAHIVISTVVATIVRTTAIVVGRVIGICIPIVLSKVIVRGHAGRAQCRSTQKWQKQVARRPILWLRAIIVLVVVVIGSHSLLLVVPRRRWLLLRTVLVSRIFRKELLRWLLL